MGEMSKARLDRRDKLLREERCIEELRDLKTQLTEANKRVKVLRKVHQRLHGWCFERMPTAGEYRERIEVLCAQAKAALPEGCVDHEIDTKPVVDNETPKGEPQKLAGRGRG